jgi:uncharacterized membrane protein YhaH (DUF805 family)
MGNLLFSPSGRLDPPGYMKAMLIIGVITAVIGLLPLVSSSIATIGGLVSLVFLYVFFAISIKRAHDAGKSGWMSIVFFILLMIVSVIVTLILFAVFGLNMMDMFSTAMEGDPQAAAAAAEAFTKSSAIPSALASLIGYPATAFLVNAMFKQDMHDNTYGPYGNAAESFS